MTVAFLAATGTPVDVQRPHAAVGEASLVIPPLAAMQHRLQQLLSDWPEHPLLSQLVAICTRIQGTSFTEHLTDFLDALCGGGSGVWLHYHPTSPGLETRYTDKFTHGAAITWCPCLKWSM